MHGWTPPYLTPTCNALTNHPKRRQVSTAAYVTSRQGKIILLALSIMDGFFARAVGARNSPIFQVWRQKACWRLEHKIMTFKPPCDKM